MYTISYVRICLLTAAVVLATTVSARADVVWYWDADGDAVGAFDQPPVYTSTFTSPGLSYSHFGFDCNDTDSIFFPGNSENIHGPNGRDDDCDGEFDETDIYATSLPGMGTHTATIGVPFTYSVTATTTSPSLNWANLVPSGMAFSTSGAANSVATFTWTPTSSDVGLHRFSAKANDTQGLDDNGAMAFGLVNVVPEPTTSLIGIAVIGFGVVRRRR